ncbi:TRAP transporter small permease [Symmachiella dynata]|uniref:TRAP transporter small permease n=1 Tax=Symmachiella dynata TaxID=2527995 RepID=UPI00118B08A9|nr:TRAP transporter small permease [Symmachiella dynata]QDT51631.1 2,3-diketo-L-gulonate TRAP transporter small permease protein YiaM [Symmachiella dynata]|tara:strand:- start:151 stop:690 length:540 start_codon:yes stop_codon:yes gene_type:complete
MAFLTRLFGGIQRIEEILLGWSIIAIAALTISNVFCRAVLQFSLPFTGELSQFFMIMVTFVGLSYAASRGRHIRMTALYDQFTPRGRKVLMIIISASTAALMLVLAWYSFQYIDTVRFLESVSPVLQVPLYLVYMLVPLGLISAAIQYALTTARNVMSPDVYISFDVKDEYEQPLDGEI